MRRGTWHAALELRRHRAEALERDGGLLLLRGRAHAGGGGAAAERRRELRGRKRRAVAHEGGKRDQHHEARHARLQRRPPGRRALPAAVRGIQLNLRDDEYEWGQRAAAVLPGRRPAGGCDHPLAARPQPGGGAMAVPGKKLKANTLGLTELARLEDLFLSSFEDALSKGIPDDAAGLKRLRHDLESILTEANKRTKLLSIELTKIYDMVGPLPPRARPCRRRQPCAPGCGAAACCAGPAAAVRRGSQPLPVHDAPCAAPIVFPRAAERRPAQDPRLQSKPPQIAAPRGA